MIYKNGFISLCKANKKDLYNWLTKQLTKYYDGNLVAKDGYIFCVGNTGVCLSAHIDTVFKQPPYEFSVDGDKVSSPQGIGGDDRCGIYGVLYIMSEMEKKGQKPYIFLSTDEEVGGSTTKAGAKACKEFALGINFILALDRQGSVDSVYYQCDNKEFKKWIDDHGFIEAQGTRTDICTLCDEWDVAGVNFSVGYYNNHTEREVVYLDELDVTLQKCMSIIEDMDPDKKFTFQRKKTSYPTNKYYGGHSAYDEDFMVNDNVFTKQYTVRAYKEPEYNSTVAFEIPAYTNLVIRAISGSWCKVEQGGKSGWVNAFNLILNYYT